MERRDWWPRPPGLAQFVDSIRPCRFAFRPSLGQVGQKSARQKRLGQLGRGGDCSQTGGRHLVFDDGALDAFGEEIDARLALKVGKIITKVGPNGLKKLDKTRKTLREETFQSLKAGRVYVLEPSKQFEPKPKASSLAAEYGLVQ